jgi:hypothetical protein
MITLNGTGKLIWARNVFNCVGPCQEKMHSFGWDMECYEKPTDEETIKCECRGIVSNGYNEDFFECAYKACGSEKAYGKSRHVWSAMAFPSSP